MKEEIWKSIEGYPNYEVSNLGNVRSLNYHRENKIKFLNPYVSNGYQIVSLCKDGKQKRFLVHRLVAQAFISNPNNHPEVNHKDENKQNNCVDNLEWCTREYNINYGTRTEQVKQHSNKPSLGKFGKEHHRSKIVYQYTKDGVFIKNWYGTCEIERELGYNKRHISSCALGKIKSAYGFIWRYKEEKAA